MSGVLEEEVLVVALYWVLGSTTKRMYSLLVLLLSRVLRVESVLTVSNVAC